MDDQNKPSESNQEQASENRQGDPSEDNQDQISGSKEEPISEARREQASSANPEATSGSQQNSRQSSQNSAKANDARRRNAAKSTGPRTASGKARVALNGCKEGLYASAIHRSLLALDEDPEEFKNQLVALIRDWKPAGRTEHMIIEHIALLELERQRVLRSLWGLQHQARENFQLDRQANARDVEASAYAGAPGKETLQKGLLNMLDSAGKFAQLQETWELIMEPLERGDFTVDVQPLLRIIFGESPTPRGASIQSSFSEFAERQKVGNPMRPDDRDDPDSAKYALLRLMVMEEHRNVLSANADFLHRHISVTPEMLDALLVPESSKYALIMRHLNAIDRQLERKLRLLMDLQKRRTELEDGGNPRRGARTAPMPPPDNDSSTPAPPNLGEGLHGPPAPATPPLGTPQACSPTHPPAVLRLGAAGQPNPLSTQPVAQTPCFPESAAFPNGPSHKPQSLQKHETLRHRCPSPRRAHTIKNEGAKLPTLLVPATARLILVYPGVGARRAAAFSRLRGPDELTPGQPD